MSERAETLLLDLGQAIQTRRRKLGLTQVQLAELAGCSTRFVHTVERGKATLRLELLLDVLQMLGLGLHLQQQRDPITVASGLRSGSES